MSARRSAGGYSPNVRAPKASARPRRALAGVLLSLLCPRWVWSTFGGWGSFLCAEGC